MKHRIGQTATGGYVVVEVRLTEVETSQPWQTVTHETLPVGTPLARLSITGEHYERGDRRGDPSSCGQNIDSLDEVTTYAPGWDAEQVADLKALWTEWHLNDMQAGCVHQTEKVYEDTQGYRRIDLDATTAANDCPAGYRYGSAWLVKPLTPEVRERIARLDRDRSADLYKARGYDGAGKAVR